MAAVSAQVSKFCFHSAIPGIKLSHHVLSKMNSIFNNQEIFQTYSSIHIINTWKKHHLHRPNVKLSCFQKSKFYTGIKIINTLPPRVQTSSMTRENFKQP